MAKAKKLASGSWRCQVYSHTEELTQPDGTIKKKRIYKSFTCDDPTAKGRRKCEAEAAEWAADKENKKTNSYKFTFGEALQLYIEERSQILSPASIRKYKSMEKNIDALKDLKIKDISQSVLQIFVNKLAEEKSPKTVRDYYGLIISVINRFCPDKAFNVTLPKKVRTDRIIPTEAEIKSLIKAVKDTDMEVPVYLGAFGMMRRGEICALNKTDFEKNIIHIHKTMVLSPDNKWVTKAPKSYSGDRFVAVPQFVADAFMNLPHDTINMTPNIITSRFEHILSDSGIRHFRFHDLRHYSASIQHALGIPDAYIMQSGGWGNDRVLKDVYRHTLSDTKDKMNNIAIDYFENMQHEMQHK